MVAHLLFQISSVGGYVFSIRFPIDWCHGNLNERSCKCNYKDFCVRSKLWETETAPSV